MVFVLAGSMFDGFCNKMEIEELLKSIDIVEFLSQYMELEERNGEYWALSVFKDEKTPSFSVRRETGKFYDFASGIGGSLINFVKQYHHISTTEAIKMLEEYAGVSDTEFKPQRKLMATSVCKTFAPQKKHCKQGKSVILPDDYMERYELRDDKLDVWRKEGISDESLKRFGVRYDAFTNRLVYPIRDIEGQIVNVGGRTLDPEWKDKKLRKYTYIQGWGGGMNVVYGLYDNLEHILRAHEVIIFEGCKSVLIADTWGIKNTAAILTSHLSPLQMKLLAALGCHVVFALDKEIDIRKDHNIQKLKRYVNVYYLYDKNNKLDEKDAPVDKGKEVFKYLYDNKYKLSVF